MQWPTASETFAARDVLTLSKMGHEVEVLALRPDNRDATNLIKSLDIENITCLRMCAKEQCYGILSLLKNLPKALYLIGALTHKERKFKSFIKSIALLPAVFRIFDRLENNKPDIVHLFWGHYPAMIGLLSLRYLPETKLTQFLGPYDLQYNYKLSSIVAKGAHSIFTHVESNRKTLIGLGIQNEKIHTIYRGIDITNTKMAAPQSNSEIVFIGRLLKTKGIFEMLDVMQIVLKHTPKARLTVIGDGEDRAAFEAAIESQKLTNSVTLTGWLTPQEIKKRLEQSSIMLFLSHSERLPNAIKEAMAFGVVPLSSNTIGIEEMITDDVDGYIVKDIKDAPMIAEKINHLILSPNIRNTMAEKARQKILDNFDVRTTMKKHEDVWLER